MEKEMAERVQVVQYLEALYLVQVVAGAEVTAMATQSQVLAVVVLVEPAQEMV
jgi:hypothetical protein